MSFIRFPMSLIRGLEASRGKSEPEKESLHETTELLKSFVKTGWQRRDANYDFVLWRPREMNRVADHYANVSMDRKHSRTWTKEKLPKRTQPISIMISRMEEDVAKQLPQQLGQLRDSGVEFVPETNVFTLKRKGEAQVKQLLLLCSTEVPV